MARQAKTVLRGALQLAVMANVLGSNPVRDVQPLRSKTQPRGAVGLTAELLRDLLQKLQASKFCQDHDLVDPITLLIATVLRRSELLGLRWIDYDDAARTLAVAGKVVRVSGEGLQRVDETKSAAGRRIVPVPLFAFEMLRIRRHLSYRGERTVISRPRRERCGTRITSARSGAMSASNSASRRLRPTASARLSPL
jgi:integrase